MTHVSLEQTDKTTVGQPICKIYLTVQVCSNTQMSHGSYITCKYKHTKDKTLYRIQCAVT